MRAGKLRHTVTIQQRTAGSPQRTASGQPDTSWTTFQAGVPCSIDPISGREYFTQQQVQGEVTHRIRLRYLAGITQSMRVLYGARVFDIVSVLNWEERNIELHLMCVEGPSNG